MVTAARAAILCACLCVIGVFLPAGEVAVKTPLSTHARAASLWELGHSTGAAKKFLDRYRKSYAKRIGAKVLDKVGSRLHGKLGSGVADVQDAMSTLDELKDSDVDTVGTAIAAVMWGLAGLCALVIALAYGADVTSGRARMVAAGVVALLVAVVGVAVHLVLRRVVAEANGELGHALFGLRGGAYMIPLAAIGAAVSVAAMVIAYVRVRAAARPPMPPPAAPAA